MTKIESFCKWYGRLWITAAWIAAAIILAAIVRDTIADPGPILIPAAVLAATLLRLTVAWRLGSRRTQPQGGHS